MIDTSNFKNIHALAQASKKFTIHEDQANATKFNNAIGFSIPKSKSFGDLSICRSLWEKLSSLQLIEGFEYSIEPRYRTNSNRITYVFSSPEPVNRILEGHAKFILTHNSGPISVRAFKIVPPTKPPTPFKADSPEDSYCKLEFANIDLERFRSKDDLKALFGSFVMDTDLIDTDFYYYGNDGQPSPLSFSLRQTSTFICHQGC